VPGSLTRESAERRAAALPSLPSHPPTHPSILTQHQVKSTRGKVVSAGKGTTLATGAAVTYSKYAGTEVTLADGKELVILKEEDVIGVLGGGPEEWGKLQPLGDRVLLQALEAAKETAGGVILASDEVERPTLGKVRKEYGEGGGGSFLPSPLVRSRRPPARTPNTKKKKKGVTMNHAN
jgi:co-chaperonin GroES (HSP10)